MHTVKDTEAFCVEYVGIRTIFQMLLGTNLHELAISTLLELVDLIVVYATTQDQCILH
jgi:hypothetical protein